MEADIMLVLDKAENISLYSDRSATIHEYVHKHMLIFYSYTEFYDTEKTRKDISMKIFQKYFWTGRICFGEIT